MKKLIFLNGPPRSGKDTIANIIVSNYNAVNLKFAQPLRDAVCGLLNISESEFDSMKNTDLSFNYRIRDLTIDLAEIIIKPNRRSR